MRHTRPLKSAGALALALLLAACVPSTDPSSPPPVSENPTVTIQGMKFTPEHVTIETGGTVNWAWDDGDMPHDVSGDGFKREVQTEGTFSHSFEEAGDFPYVCALHSGMRGTVTVVRPS